MMNIDMWYGNKVAEVDSLDTSFSDIDCVYRGNLYIKGRIVGDYSTNDSLALEKAFPQLVFNW